MLLEELFILIKYVGLSNETPYGVMKFVQVAERSTRHPKIVSGLLCQTFDSGLAECCHHERISLLAYSPLAMGILSGKYFLPDGRPADARLNLFRGEYSEGEPRYNLSDHIIRAAAMEYIDIAGNYSVHPVSLAIGDSETAISKCNCPSFSLLAASLTAHWAGTSSRHIYYQSRASNRTGPGPP
ncbi:unnamed protein product [Prunus brigantina]